MTQIQDTREGQRLSINQQGTAHWKHWGPYLSDRQWGTVREDYSADGQPWTYFSYEDARFRAYRWGEDGIAGLCDSDQRLCFAVTLWNGQDDFLKERLFGLTNGEGNHGEDVKEYYFYLDNVPTHAYMKCLYKYPQAKFPYADLRAENARRKADPASFEYELLDTGVFAENRYFDVLIEYAKQTPEDICIQLTITNRGPEVAPLHVLPTLWFRNNWSWDHSVTKPLLRSGSAQQDNLHVIEAQGGAQDIGTMWLYAEGADGVLFTENETNNAHFGWGANASPYVKDAFEQYIIHGQQAAVNPAQVGTKATPAYALQLAAGETRVLRLRLSNNAAMSDLFEATNFSALFQTRQQEAAEFYQAVNPNPLSDDLRNIQHQAFVGMLWNKQFYYYMVKEWLNGDPAYPPPPAQRKNGRNSAWKHLFMKDIISMPDTWEYPWFAAWDLAFHAIPLAMIDSTLAKQQMLSLMQPWSMHPNGQIPAYEWSFNDLNPPVQAWAAWRVYKIEAKMYGAGDRIFLEQVFQKLALYFTWWLNRKDVDGNDIFQGGFLGLDNIGPFDRSNIPAGISGYVDQSDATGWMGMFSLNMLRIAIELASQDVTYEQMAVQFLLQFLFIARAINEIGDDGENLWDDVDGFYYDVLHLADDVEIDGQKFLSLKLRSVVGLVPLLAIEGIDLKFFNSPNLADFRQRFDHLLNANTDLTSHDNVEIQGAMDSGFMQGIMLALVKPERLKRILTRLLDENEFLSPYGIRSLSKYHEQHPYILPGITAANGQPYKVQYTPAESRTNDFGGNSNWRGPIWFPINFLLIEALQKFHQYLGDSFKVECPTGSGNNMTLWEVAAELSARLMSIFQQDSANGQRPVYGGVTTFQSDPDWKDFILFYEYFHGDNGAGLGASHQTGWTGVVAKLIQQWSEYTGQNQAPRPSITDL
ncbi:MGH1-like glycoside hydrolase domain-containing protein [Dictyobacter kobayashii]|uniref:Glucosidase n=1 Tax=Dictyobacter kobayashii TaxID=2014872 RepID=A0A402AIQ5_9CHLR|nr:glucosidase [Dictyobacter kobayashii]GCE18986.1 glucosidase [Dictyobacter kobayashii]